MSSNETVSLAEEFWARVGGPPPFPRDLEPVALISEGIAVATLRRLSPATAAGWLGRRSLDFPLRPERRPLDGLIVAYRGAVILFLNKSLSEEERRVVLAHEFGHFLADYDRPRRRAVARLGPDVVAVLDGERPATTAEDLAAVLAGVPLSLHVHYLERGFDPNRLAATDRVERRANELACELLAPRAVVLARCAELGLPHQPGRWEELLRKGFGFPPRWARAYASFLLRLTRPRPTFSELLGL